MQAGSTVRIDVGDAQLEGELQLVEGGGLVVFVHGSGSSRFSPRNRFVASQLRGSGHGTLLLDLLTPEEERVDQVTAMHRFDIPLLARRVSGVLEWLRSRAETGDVPVGLFGSSTGAAAALIAAAERPLDVAAVVSRGGRVDLAHDHLSRVKAATLLIVGERDTTVLGLNRSALGMIGAVKRLEVVPGATHLFEEPGALDEVARLAANWFTLNLKAGK
ncbi:hydrolase [Candidatus Bathyarchaeota archaeon RBG_13_60_20]|nr:MAG: hydrolase [Candidatus Bathyarchaeota archaeon RBG_13_60_20]